MEQAEKLSNQPKPVDSQLEKAILSRLDELLTTATKRLEVRAADAAIANQEMDRWQAAYSAAREEGCDVTKLGNFIERYSNLKHRVALLTLDDTLLRARWFYSHNQHEGAYTSPQKLDSLLR